MSVSIGLIGCGQMGAGHARILASGVAGGHLAAVYDADRGRAELLAAAGRHIGIYAMPDEMIAAKEIDAVLIASPDETHASLALSCIRAGKPVLCEKPLATNLDACLEIIAAECAAGRRLVQVGFMRRFDPGYCIMHDTVQSGTLGAPIFLHHVHRNAIAPDYITSDQVIANSSSHEFDITRYMLSEEIVAVSVTSARPSRRSLQRQPHLIVLESEHGTVVTIEAFSDAHYGYDVHGELVCEDGTVALSSEQPVMFKTHNRNGWNIEMDWLRRFGRAYEMQLHKWIASIRNGTPCGASAWDGYAASRIAVAALDATHTQARVRVGSVDRPALYRPM